MNNLHLIHVNELVDFNKSRKITIEDFKKSVEYEPQFDSGGLKQTLLSCIAIKLGGKRNVYNANLIVVHDGNEAYVMKSRYPFITADATFSLEGKDVDAEFEKLVFAIIRDENTDFFQ